MTHAGCFGTWKCIFDIITENGTKQYFFAGGNLANVSIKLKIKETSKYNK